MALRPLRVGITQSNRSMPRRDRLQQVLRPTDAHQIARPIGRQGWHRDVEHRDTFRPALRRRSARPRHSLENRAPPAARAQATRSSGSSPPWTMANRAWSCRRAARARAAQRIVRSAGIADHRRLARQRHHVVEHHRHVAAQWLLNGDRSSGVSSNSRPSIWERNTAPASVTWVSRPG